MAPTMSEPTIAGSVQPRSLPWTRRPDDGEQAAADEPEAGEVEAVDGPWVSVEAEERERDREQPDRDVDPEDPLPGEALGDRATDERPDRDREAGDAAPGAERDGASLRRGRRPTGWSGSAA